TLDVGGEAIDLDQEDIQVRLQAREGWAAAQGRGCVVVLSTQLTPELVREGYARDLVRLIQDRRKATGCEYTDRIEVGLVTSSPEIQLAVQENSAYVQGETLAQSLSFAALPGDAGVAQELGDVPLTLYVRVIK